MEDEEEDDGGDERSECRDDRGDTDAVQRREDGDSDLDGGRSRGLTQCLNKKVFLCVGAADNSRSLKAKKARDRREKNEDKRVCSCGGGRCCGRRCTTRARRRG